VCFVQQRLPCRSRPFCIRCFIASGWIYQDTLRTARFHEL
jgi:hypothetical protein